MSFTLRERFWDLLLPCAVLIYCLFALLLIWQNPGLQYDEALLVLGGVQMRISRGELPLPHDPDTWYCLRGHCLQLMTVRYVGALKDYLSILPFALFGPSSYAVRILSMLLGAIGIWGVGRTAIRHWSKPAGALIALAIAINPAYLNMTVFDNGTVSAWMAAFGLLCVAVGAYTSNPTTRTAFWMGAAMGLGIWARANFAWLLIAMLAAAAFTLGKRLMMLIPHMPGLIVGGLAGGFPFLAYQIHSRGGTLEAGGMFSAEGSWSERLFIRWTMFSETLLSDREHRVIWNGPWMPDWQRLLFPALVAVGCLICLAASNRLDPRRAPWARAVALTFLVLGAIFFTSRLPVAEHHLIVLVPLAAAIVVMGCSLLQMRFARARIASAVIAAVYLSSALVWQIDEVGGLRATGGVGPWSNGIFALNHNLRRKFPDREIKVLDWGLQNNLFILSDGKLRTREIFETSSDEKWAREVKTGGLFLLNGPDNRQIPAASTAFLKALAEGQVSSRKFTVRQGNGAVFAELIEVQPGPFAAASAGSTGASGLVWMGDPAAAQSLEGFHELEEGAWRWTNQKFAVTLPAPESATETGGHLSLQLNIPDVILQKLGPVSLTARLGGQTLCTRVYPNAGEQKFECDVKASWLRPGSNRFEFALDKSLSPAPDGRELGIIVVRASLDGGDAW